MNYNHRCKITTKTKKPGYLGDDKIVSETKVYPCGKTSLSSDEQVNVFGKYTNTAFKLHFQTHIDKLDAIEFEGVRRNIYDVRYPRNTTVVIVS